MILQLAFVLTAIIIGARLGGIGLGVMGGVGLAILTFVFGLQPTAPPIDVMLMIAAVISGAACVNNHFLLSWELPVKSVLNKPFSSRACSQA